MSGRRILYVSPNAKRGGAEQALSLFLKHHHREKWCPQVYFLNEGPLVDEFQNMGIKCHVGPKVKLRNPRSVLAAVRDIKTVVREERINLMHSVMGYGHIFGGLAAKMSGVPEVWFQHGPTGRLDWLVARVPTATLFINSKYTASQQERYHPWTSRTMIIYPGIEPLSPETFAEEARLLSKKHGFNPERQEVIFGIIGRITPMKGQTLLIEAARELRKTDPHFKILIIGATFMPMDLIYLENLNAMIRDYDLEKNIHFTGHLTPPYAGMLACDVIINASVVPEPFGLTIIEGMMLGKPVIAPANGGPLEIITDGSTGVFFKPGNPISLAEKMRLTIRASALRTSIGQNAREEAIRRFTIDKTITELEAEYDRLTKGA
jgi:glycosyltransferase involved in cell wall biosynthesis